MATRPATPVPAPTPPPPPRVEAAPAKPAGRSKKFIVIAAASALGLVLLGLSVYLFKDKLFGGSHAVGETTAEAAVKTSTPITIAKKKAAEAEPAATEEEAVPKPKKKAKRVVEEAAGILILEPFTVNLQDTENTRYMRLVINLGLNSEKAAKAAEAPLLKAKVRNAVMRYITTLTVEAVLSKDGKEVVVEKLIEATNEVLEDGVVDVYIQELIVQ